MNTFFLQQPAGGGGNNFLFMMIAMFAIIYLFMILPQKRKQKKERLFLSELKKGQNVVTTSGMYAKVAEVSETTCILETSAGKIKFEKSAISVEFTNKLYGEPTQKK